MTAAQNAGIETAGPAQAEATTRFTSFDGQCVQVETFTQGTGRAAVILLLPIGVTAASVAPLIGTLSAWCDVYALRSRFVLDEDIVLEESHRIDASAHERDVGALADAFDLARFAVLGYCTGGLVAVRAAFRFPDRVAALASCNGAFELSQRTQYERELVEVVAACAGRRRTARIVRKTLVAARRRRSEFDEHTNLPLRDDETFYKYATCLQAMYEEGLAGLEGRSAVPSLLIAGDADEIVSPQNSSVPLPLLADAVLRIEEGGDHYLPCRPGRTIDDIDAFLRSHLCEGAS